MVPQRGIESDDFRGEMRGESSGHAVATTIVTGNRASIARLAEGPRPLTGIVVTAARTRAQRDGANQIEGRLAPTLRIHKARVVHRRFCDSGKWSARTGGSIHVITEHLVR